MTTVTIRPPDIKVEDIMTKTVHTVELTMSVKQAIKLLTHYNVSGAPIVDNLQNVVSVISEGDALKLAAMPGGMDKLIGACLDQLPKTANLITTRAHNSFADVYKQFLHHPFHRIIVVDGNGKLVGLVSRSNILRLLVETPKSKPKK